MRRALEAKLKNEELRQFLLDSTDATLKEASPFDKFERVGLSRDNPRI